MIEVLPVQGGILHCSGSGFRLSPANMRLSEIYKLEVPTLSFEIFPPKQDKSLDELMQTARELTELKPDFISVTYGAGGTSQSNTIEAVSRMRKDLQVETMAHLTCVGKRKSEVDTILAKLKENGVFNILALRGDPPRNDPDFDFSRGEFRYASDLITYIRQKGHFDIAAAAYPEGHQDCPTIDKDWENLKRKVDCGVNLLITQLFFDNRVFLHFRDTVRKMGVRIPIIPGVMPIQKAEQVVRFAMCGASIPAKLIILLDKYGKSEHDMRRAGVEYAVEQIQQLMSEGVDGIHLYTMNKPVLAREILKSLPQV